MHLKVKHRYCPTCGEVASTNDKAMDHTHQAVHGFHEWFKHGHPLLLLLGAIAAGAHLFNSFRFTCKHCKSSFFAR